MRTSWIRRVRRSVGLVWIALFACLVSLVGLSHLAPATGHEIFVVRGSSMAPAIPMGAVIVTSPVAPADVAVGDVVTVKGDNRIIYTHRVVEVVETHGVRAVRLKGDANDSPDGALVPAVGLIGRVDLQVPAAGFVLGLLSMPSGVMSVMSMLGCLLLAYWLLEDLEPLPETTAGTAVARDTQVA